jgi:Arc/MetJ-type ribon-helix-helix transcriptional regulator
MPLNLSKETEQLIKNAVETGHLDSADEVITEAIELYLQHHQHLESRLLEGIADAKAGRLHEYGPEMMEDIKQKALQKIAARKSK